MKNSNCNPGHYQDGIYSPAAVELRPAPALILTTKKGIRTLLAMESNFTVNRNLSFTIDASYFFAGSYVNATGKGKDIICFSFYGKFEILAKISFRQIIRAVI